MLKKAIVLSKYYLIEFSHKTSFNYFSNEYVITMFIILIDLSFRFILQN